MDGYRLVARPKLTNYGLVRYGAIEGTEYTMAGVAEHAGSTVRLDSGRFLNLLGLEL